jgi:superoxide reductase
MTSIHQIYKCEICGNIIEVLHEGAGKLVCCGQPMKLLEENTVDAEQLRESNPKANEVESKREKHVPVIKGNKVFVGVVEHPMTEEHYIEWLEASDGKQTSKVFLKPKQKPEAEFGFKPKIARAYCNLHGLWKSK